KRTRPDRGNEALENGIAPGQVPLGLAEEVRLLRGDGDLPGGSRHDVCSLEGFTLAFRRDFYVRNIMTRHIDITQGQQGIIAPRHYGPGRGDPSTPAPGNPDPGILPPIPGNPSPGDPPREPIRPQPPPPMQPPPPPSPGNPPSMNG